MGRKINVESGNDMEKETTIGTLSSICQTLVVSFVQNSIIEEFAKRNAVHSSQEECCTKRGLEIITVQKRNTVQRTTACMWQFLPFRYMSPLIVLTKSMGTSLSKCLRTEMNMT